MKGRYLIIILSGLVFISALALVYRMFDKSNFETYEKAIEERYPYNVISDPSTYIRDCRLENNKAIRFPMAPVANAKLHYNGLFKISRTITGEPLSSVLTILNDSSSYQWGEMGTPEFYWHLTFYDTAANCIGVTKICIEGQTYSSPNLARMKWGLLTEKARLTLKSLLED